MTVKPFSRLNYNARNYNVVSAVMVPVYGVTASSSSINEGTAVTYTITTQYVLDGTVLYWTTSGTTVAADFSDGVTSGSVTMTNGTATVVRTLTSDLLTEGAETIVFELRTVSTSGTIVASTPSGTVNDVSVLTITPSTSSVNEGSSVTWTISAIGFGTGTLYWTNSGTTTGSDFSDGVNSGSIAITSDAGTLTKTLLSDLSTEGSETIIIQIRTGSTSGTVVGTSNTVTVADTSYSSQSYSVYFNTAASGLSVAHNTALDLSSGDFTIECWYYKNTTSVNGEYIVAKSGNAGNRFHAYCIVSSGTNTYSFNLGNSTGASIIQGFSFGTLNLNTWYHLAATKSGSTITLFVNGTQVASAAQTITIVDNGSALTVGNQYTDTSKTVLTTGGSQGQVIGGYVSNLRIIKGTAIYTAGTNFTPPTDQLSAVSGTVLLTCKNASFSDSSSNAFTVNSVGTNIIKMENPFGNYSTYFPSGAGSNYVVPHSSTLDFGTGDFTIEFWMYAISMPNAAGIIGKKADDTTNGWQIAYNSTYPTNRMTIRLTQQIDFTSTSSWTLNVWDHWAVTRSGTTVSWFKNGVLDATGTNSSNISEVRSVYIGYSETWAGYFTGYLSNIRVVKGTALYSSNFIPSTSALTAISGTSLLTCQYSEIMDASTNHATITAVVPRPNNQNPFGNYYASFNGSNQALTIAAPTTVFNGMGSVNCTFEAWVCPGAYVGGRQNIITRWGGGGLAFQFSLISNQVVLKGTFTASVWGSTTLSSNQWYHIAAVYIGTSKSVTIYVNGVSDGSGTITNIGDADATVNVAIGAYNDLNDEWYNGYISNLRIVKGVAVYTGAFTPPISPLTATQSSGTNIAAITGTSTILLTCQYANFVDSSTNVLAITNTTSVKSYLTDKFSGIVNGVNYAQKNYSLSLNVNGTSQYAVASLTSNALDWALSQNWTLECWVYPISRIAIQDIFGKSCTTSDTDWAFYINSSGNLCFYNANNVTLTSTGVVAQNTWSHVAVVIASNQLIFYINGVVASTAAAILAATNGGGGVNGYYMGGMNGRYPSQYVSNLRVVKGVAVYTGTFTPSTSPLKTTQSSTTNIAAITTQTAFLSCQYNTLFDASNNKITITKYGGIDMAPVYPFPA